MFAVGLNFLEISPSCMRFNHWWIYNLSPLHETLKNKIQSEMSSKLFFGSSPWKALLQAYGISLFSPLPRLQAFSEDYHAYFQTRVSRNQIEKLFQRLYHLGLDRVGHLRKLPYSQIYKRFGKDWADFIKGVLEPEETHWKWISYCPQKILNAHIDPEFSICEIPYLSAEIFRQLEEWAKKNLSLFFSKLLIQLIGLDSDTDQNLELEFPKRMCLQKDLPWVKKIIHERLSRVELLSPITRIQLKLECSPPRQSVQLSLFQDRSSPHCLKELCNKLRTQGYQAFVPRPTHSFLPERSWEKAEPELYYQFPEKSIFRPLIQYPPRPIPAPEGRVFPTEILHWTDSKGCTHSRQYYICRSYRKWIWVFKDERGSWFEQGILE